MARTGAGARVGDDQLLALEPYRQYVLLDERLVPYVRAAAATAARCGLPIIRPLFLADPGDPRGWAIADAYGYGPSPWVAPVLEAGVVEREVDLPHGDWIDFWTGERGTDRQLSGRPRGPRARRHARARAATGGDAVGEPVGGRVLVRLADGTYLRWTRGGWPVTGGAT